MTRNLLDCETSPYLLQHKDNPVHWQAWGEEALNLAKRDNKPILLSVGYSACHWCHVMAHESFENDDIAAVMNDLFVNIKVDREERPDLDAIYQTALALMGQHGGWPLTMFLTPDGEPFWGGTYFPPTTLYGRPGFVDVLTSVSETYQKQLDKVEKNVAALRDGLAKQPTPTRSGRLSADLIDRTAAALLRMVDPLHGGTLGAPKFPQPVLFRYLWHAFRRTRSPMFREGVTTTLDNICQGGIYDHVGGGFARYATDDVWLVPHFEKMLYDNALLAELLTEVWLETRNPLYALRVRESLEWVLRDMRNGPDGGDGSTEAFAFASAYDADSEGEEGKYYVWREDEIDALLGADAVPFKRVYDVSAHGNWEAVNILNRRVADGFGPPELEERLERCRQRLLEVRAGRVPPLRDDKVLADWNGLMIAALAKAGAVFEEPRWVAAARTAFAFVRDHMSRDGRLLHSWCMGRARHAAVLDDYANMSRAAVVLYQVTGELSYLHRAEDWVVLADTHHWDPDGKGYFLAADDTRDLIARSKTIHDNATPSGNGIMAEVLAALYHFTGKASYRTRAEELVDAFAGESPETLVSQPGLLIGYELLQEAVQVVVVGDRDDDRTEELARIVLEAPVPTRLLTRFPLEAALPAGHPAHGKSAVDGRATAYICRGPVCGLPVTEADALRRELVGARAP